MIFENRDLPVNTASAKHSNRDTENSEKVLLFEQQTCKGLEICNVPSLCGILQI